MKRLIHSPRLLLILILAIALLAGYFTAPDYGLSWDEVAIYRHANRAIGAYPFILHPQDYQMDDSDTNLNLYGPAHFMLSAALSHFILALQPSWSIYSAYHFIYFLTFLFGVFALYLLSTRWISEWAAFGIALLFATQPLFWGNAFINPKDLPFMTFFIASMYFGLRMLDDSPNSKWGKILVAGIILGVTTSIRSLGPMAGAFVILYGLWKSPRKTISILPYYLLIAVATTYLTWPYLWKGPVTHFIESLQVMSKFPNTGETLFMGKLYPADQLPLTYFPTLVSLQLTEPLLILIAIGAALSLWSFVKGKNREPILLFTLWFLIPALYIGLSGSTLYDNARQLLFLLPPLLIFAGIGLDALLERIKIPLLKVILVLVILLPGIYACVQLHPYEYVYFNSLMGGVRGAFRNFDLDYSGVSFMEAQEYINANAEPGTQVVVIGGPRHVARTYARIDLKNRLTGTKDPIDLGGVDYYYVLFLTRTNADKNRCLNGETVFTVERDGGILAYIKKVNSDQKCW
jgi:4-amino-4-deoxy-L-arabinose transferase-like glycosyltransferase